MAIILKPERLTMTNQNSIPNLFTVKQFCEKHSVISYGSLRDRLFHSQTNGLKASGAVVRNGRRILIDEEKFFNWLREYGA